MRVLVLASILLSMAISTSTVEAQPVTEFDRILLPLTPERVNGAAGSIWSTEVAITNLSDAPLQVLGYQQEFGCNILCAGPPPIPPRATIFVKFTPRCNEVRGKLLFVELGRASDLSVTIRSRDLSRQAETWGTTVPIVTLGDLFAHRFTITDVPMESQFRSTLRIYDFNANPGSTVRLRIYGIDSTRDFPRDDRSDVLLHESTIALTLPFTGGGTRSCPGFAELSLSAIPALAAAQRVRVEIEPLDGTNDYWAFVSVTHNTTQHVTVLSPR